MPSYGVDDYGPGFSIDNPTPPNTGRAGRHPVSAGNPWYTGYPGTEGAVGGGGYGAQGGTSFGFPIGSPQWAASKAAYDQMMAAAERSGQRLAPGQFLGGGMGGPLGNAAMGNYTDPYGFDPQALAGQQAMIRDSFAGQQANAVRNIEQSAAAKGFGDSMGVIDAGARARAQANQGQNQALNQLMFENERAKLAQSGTAAGLLGSLAGAEADYGLAYAASQMNRQFPAIPGITGTYGQQGGYGGQGGYGSPQGNWWNQQGQHQTGPMPYDPYTPPTTGSGAPTGYNPQQPWSPW